MLSAYSGDVYKSGDRSAPPPTQTLVVAPAGAGSAPRSRPPSSAAASSASHATSRATSATSRANVLTPSIFAERAAAIAKSRGSEVEVLDEDEIARWAWACCSASRAAAPSRRG